MSAAPFFVIGYPKAREYPYPQLIGPFPDQTVADEYILSVLEHIQFKTPYVWQTVWLYEPDMYRRPSGDVSV